jgi:aminodeoxyfutalosine deaminase
MPVFHADWILPIVRGPLRDGWVDVREGRITAVGEGRPPADTGAGRAESGLAPGDASVKTAILPGLVNAHTHLELSWMRGLVPPVGAMPLWASRLIEIRRHAAVTDDPARDAAVVDGVEGARRAGTSLVGDISNSPLADAPLLASGMRAVIFRELIGFRDQDPGPAIEQGRRSVPSVLPSGVRTTLTPHAPYSVAPRLLQAIHADTAGPFSIHLGESAAEVEFLRNGSGPWREILKRVGAWEPSWAAPGTGPVDYLATLGLLGPRLIAVHGVHLEDRELSRLADAGATLVTCPRSNAWTGAGVPPLDRFYAYGIRVAVGTDSLASVDTLSVFDELAAMRRLAPAVPASTLLRSATLDGAAALGFGDELGAIAPGLAAALLAVSVPAGTIDVEEYLLSGVPPDRIRWLPAA